jgi:PadR family transcriptional regulator PadR
MPEIKSDVLQGTLDLMVLKTLESMGPLHGYGIARRIEQVSEDTVSLNQGTIYPALLRLEQRGWVKAEWGMSETKRRAKFYSLTRSGRKQMDEETENWERMAATMARFLAPFELGGAYGFDTDYLEPLRGAVRSPQAGRRP